MGIEGIVLVYRNVTRIPITEDVHTVQRINTVAIERQLLLSDRIDRLCC